MKERVLEVKEPPVFAKGTLLYHLFDPRPHKHTLWSMVEVRNKSQLEFDHVNVFKKLSLYFLTGDSRDTRTSWTEIEVDDWMAHQYGTSGFQSKPVTGLLTVASHIGFRAL